MTLFWSVVAFLILNVLLGLTAICYTLYDIYTMFGIEMLVVAIAGSMFLIVGLIAFIIQFVRRIKSKVERLKNMTYKELFQLIIRILKR